MKTHIKKLSVLTVILITFGSCDLEPLESAQEVAEGGGTIDTYTAYTIEASDPMGSNVNGRVVFWKTDLDQTLVQISLYNTIPGILHPALVLEGAVGSGGTTMLTLGDVSGDTGELNSNKFFLITNTGFYDSILTMDSHINIYLSATDDTIVATGNLGINGAPVESN